ncbi:MAG: RNase adapter RapZ [Actinomycetota bacterium]|nr:RNase adapter RapZ [Actinomycetota bacterium]
MSAAVSAPRFTLITGLSGAGRSEVAKVFEDLGYFVVDNIPPALIEKMVELVSAPGSKVKQIALVVDVRGGEFFPELEKALDGIKDRGFDLRVLFLEASDRSLVRRFEATRRKHPLAQSDRVVEGIFQERQIMRRLRDVADVIIDTTDLNVHELRDKVSSLFADPSARSGIAVNVISFGYKHGIPLDADIILDCRFLPNPHWVDELRPLNGTHRKVRGYVLNAPGTEEFLFKLRDLLGFLLPGFVNEGRHYLTIGIGCTGGKHRSVVVGDEIARYLQEKGFPSTVVHRDLDRE